MTRNWRNAIDPKKWLMLLINILGGAAVLGSYAFGILAHPNASQVLWGEVPESIRPFYTANILRQQWAISLLSISFCSGRIRSKWVAGRSGFGLFSALFAGILIPSALWMPLTFMGVERSSLALVWAVRIVLWLVDWPLCRYSMPS